MNVMRANFGVRHQRGATLIVALLFLIVMTLFAVASYNSSTTNMRVTGNMVARQEALSAAQSAIDEVISNTIFTSDPAAVAASTYPVDIDGNGEIEYQPQITPAPSCHRVRAIKTLELDPADPADVVCFTSGAVNSGVEFAPAGATAGNSLCANTEWNIRAEVDDARTATRVAINQGIGVRALETDAADFCD